jgi:hypothetical protein
MHTAEARAKGETERIYLLSAWREAPCYTKRERAALGWAEALTTLATGYPQETARLDLQAAFTEEEQVKLTLMINVINGTVINGLINGLPGFVTLEADGELQTTALEIADGAIIAIYISATPTSCAISTEGGAACPANTSTCVSAVRPKYTTRRPRNDTR